MSTKPEMVLIMPECFFITRACEEHAVRSRFIALQSILNVKGGNVGSNGVPPTQSGW